MQVGFYMVVHHPALVSAGESLAGAGYSHVQALSTTILEFEFFSIIYSKDFALTQNVIYILHL